MLFKSYIYNKKKSFLKIKMRKTIYHKKALDYFFRNYKRHSVLFPFICVCTCKSCCTLLTIRLRMISLFSGRGPVGEDALWLSYRFQNHPEKKPILSNFVMSQIHSLEFRPFLSDSIVQIICICDCNVSELFKNVH